MIRAHAVAATLAALLALAACGQKGPLKLPEGAKPAPQDPSAPQNPPAPQKP